MNDHFPYVYDRGHWIRDSESDDMLTLRKVVETALCFFAMCAVLVLVMIGWLCGYAGVITSISFDLCGCVQAIVHPGLDKDGKLKESNWFDVARLEVTDGNPVMDRLDFDFGLAAEGRKGPAEKPAMIKS